MLEGGVPWVYQDLDGDGAGDPRSARRWSAALVPGPLGPWVLNDLDCDDSDPELRPFGPDRPGDGVDQDCDSCDGRCDD